MDKASQFNKHDPVERVRRAVDEAHKISTTHEHQRLRLRERDIVIGIPYRDDAWGEAILRDIDVVARGTRCRVIVIPPGLTLNVVRVDALFFPGGPFDQPGTVSVEGSRPRLPKPALKRKKLSIGTSGNLK